MRQGYDSKNTVFWGMLLRNASKRWKTIKFGAIFRFRSATLCLQRLSFVAIEETNNMSVLRNLILNQINIIWRQFAKFVKTSVEKVLTQIWKFIVRFGRTGSIFGFEKIGLVMNQKTRVRTIRAMDNAAAVSERVAQHLDISIRFPKLNNVKMLRELYPNR